MNELTLRRIIACVALRLAAPVAASEG